MTGLDFLACLFGLAMSGYLIGGRWLNAALMAVFLLATLFVRGASQREGEAT